METPTADVQSSASSPGIPISDNNLQIPRPPSHLQVDDSNQDRDKTLSDDDSFSLSPTSTNTSPGSSPGPNPDLEHLMWRLPLELRLQIIESAIVGLDGDPRYQLSQLSLVNHEWSRICRPLLFRRLRLSCSTDVQFLSKILNNRQYGWLAASITELDVGCILDTIPLPKDRIDLERALKTCAGKLPSLHHLRYSGLSRAVGLGIASTEPSPRPSPFSLASVSSSLRPFLAGYSNICSLELSGVRCHSLSVFIQLLGQLSSLERLDCADIHWDVKASIDRPPARMAPFPALHHVAGRGMPESWALLWLFHPMFKQRCVAAVDNPDVKLLALLVQALYGRVEYDWYEYALWIDYKPDTNALTIQCRPCPSRSISSVLVELLPSVSAIPNGIRGRSSIRRIEIVLPGKYEVLVPGAGRELVDLCFVREGDNLKKMVMSFNPMRRRDFGKLLQDHFQHLIRLKKIYMQHLAEKKALVIGVQNYPRLASTDADVRHVHMLLTGLLKYDEENVVVMTDDPPNKYQFPSRANILNAIDDLAGGSSAGDHFVLYFSVPRPERTGRNTGFDEEGLDKAIWLIDEVNSESADFILGNDLRDHLIDRLHPKSYLVMIFDVGENGFAVDLDNYHSNCHMDLAKPVLHQPVQRHVSNFGEEGQLLMISPLIPVPSTDNINHGSVRARSVSWTCQGQKWVKPGQVETFTMIFVKAIEDAVRVAESSGHYVTHGDLLHQLDISMQQQIISIRKVVMQYAAVRQYARAKGMELENNIMQVLKNQIPQLGTSHDYETTLAEPILEMFGYTI